MSDVGQNEQSGPDDEQLGLSEDTDRLADIGDLIRAGHARLEEFDLTKWERVFLDGYLNGTGDD